MSTRFVQQKWPDSSLASRTICVYWSDEFIIRTKQFQPQTITHQWCEGQNISCALPAQAGVQSSRIPQQEGIIPTMKHEITEATPSDPSSEPLLNQPQGHPSPVLVPTTTPDTAPDSNREAFEGTEAWSSDPGILT